MPCMDCGAPAREYDHARGYEGVSAVDVDAVCFQCHGRRTSARGELPSSFAHPRARARLTAEQVTTVRELARIGFTQDELGAMYGLTQSGVSAIVTRKNWRHVA